MTKSLQVAIVDTGVANLASVTNALARLEAPFLITRDADVLRSASHVILPGVGSAPAAMAAIRGARLEDLISELTQPILGICLGMQILFQSSEEGESPCLGIFPERIQKFPDLPDLPVPHMGWNSIEKRFESPLLAGIPSGSDFYFVHSYIAPVAKNTLATTTYGSTFASVIGEGNRFGVQFHPERSGRMGSLLLRNFLNL